MVRSWCETMADQGGGGDFGDAAGGDDLDVGEELLV